MGAFKHALGVMLLSLAFAVQANPGKAAGTAAVVVGSASAVSATGETRTLRKDDAVYSGDRIVTGRNGYLRLGFMDGGSIMLRPNTEFLIEGFAFDPSQIPSKVKVVEPAKPAEPSAAPAVPALQIGSQAAASGNQALFRLVRGGFRAVSGLIGKLNREEYAVRTPVATIGIRGTVYLSWVCDEICAADPEVISQLSAQDTALGGLVSHVDQGEISVTSNTGNSVVVKSTEYVLTTQGGNNITLPKLPQFIANDVEFQKFIEETSKTIGKTPSGGTAGGQNTPPGLKTVLNTVTLSSGAVVTIAITAAVLTLDGDDGHSPTSSNPAPTQSH